MFNTTTLLAVAFVLLWNTGFTGAEYGLPYADTFTLLFWRYWALVFILGLYLTFRKRLHWPGWSITAAVCLVGVLAHGVWLSCVLLSLQTTVPAGIVALIVALQPMATGALSGRVVGEPTPIYRWVGLIIGFCGVVITVMARLDLNNPQSIFGYAIPFGSAVAMTAASLIQRKLELQNIADDLTNSQTLFYQSLATALVLTGPAILL